MQNESMPHWRELSTLDQLLTWPEGYVVAELKYTEVDELIKKLLLWHPQGISGEALRFVDREFYSDEVSFLGTKGHSVQIYVGKYQNDIVCMFCLEHDLRTRTLHGRYGVVAPEHRKSGIGVATVQVIEYQAVELNCSVIASYATLWHPYVQQLLERRGYKPVGIFPGRDLEFDSESGELVRVPEVLYVKQLTSSEEVVLPKPFNMTPAVKNLYELLFASS